MKDLLIFGAGGHAREVAQLVADINQAQPDRWTLLGFLADEGAPPGNPRSLQAPLLGDAHWLHEHPDVHVVVAIGEPAARRTVVQRLLRIQPRLRFATLVHPRAWLANRVTLGAGGVIFAGALVNVDVAIGAHASLNLACTLSHDCVLGDYVSLGPGVHLAGGVLVGEGVDIGTGASFRPRVSVGDGAIIGAGAVVTHHLPAGCTAVGVPARPRGA